MTWPTWIQQLECLQQADDRNFTSVEEDMAQILHRNHQAPINVWKQDTRLLWTSWFHFSLIWCWTDRHCTIKTQTLSFIYLFRASLTELVQGGSFQVSRGSRLRITELSPHNVLIIYIYQKRSEKDKNGQDLYSLSLQPQNNTQTILEAENTWKTTLATENVLFSGIF